MPPTPQDLSILDLEQSDRRQALHDGISVFVLQLGGLIRALHWVQREFGFIDTEDYLDIAEVFNLSIAEVRGVVSFYHDFRTTPPPKHTVRICQAEACQALGARELTTSVESRLKTELNGRTDDGAIELKAVYCLGLCALGPSMEINGRLIARASEQDLDSIS